MKELIEREAVQEILKKYSVGTWRGIPSYPDEIRRASIDVDKIPVADVVERKRGEWVNIIEAKVDTTGVCNHCVKEAVWRTHNGPYPICPNCGADMRGEKHEAD